MLLIGGSQFSIKKYLRQIRRRSRHRSHQTALHNVLQWPRIRLLEFSTYFLWQLRDLPQTDLIVSGDVLLQIDDDDPFSR